MTIEMVKYLMLLSRREMVKALKRMGYKENYNGMTNKILALTLVEYLIENEIDFEELKILLR